MTLGHIEPENVTNCIMQESFSQRVSEFMIFDAFFLHVRHFYKFTNYKMNKRLKVT